MKIQRIAKIEKVQGLTNKKGRTNWKRKNEINCSQNDTKEKRKPVRII
jgi:hypothetical protein